MFHVLRHTFASVRLEADDTIVSVSARLGYSSRKAATQPTKEQFKGL